jgi:hypothetical protein
MISQRNGLLLDDMTVEEVARELRRPVVPAGEFAEIAADLRGRKPRSARRIAA